jgi:hypothetical protein
MRSRIEPMKKIARSGREHSELILNCFRAGDAAFYSARNEAAAHDRGVRAH